MIKLVHHEMVINSKFLEVPRSYYQRHLNASRVKRIAAEFDERIANAPKVSYRDGHYYVFDGQHTIAARKLLNNNSDLNIVCKVYSGLTEQEEALLFAQQTGISAPLTAGAKLRAKIHGGDPEAIAFQSATQRAGFGLSFNQSHAKWKIACIATAFGEYRQHGERIYTEALRVLAEAWEGDIDSLRSEVLQGVVRFIALYDHEYDPVRLIRQLKRTSPVTIYRSGQAMSGPNYQKYMYNHYVRDGFGKLRISKIKYSDIKKFYYSLILEKGFKPNSMEIVHTLLHPTFTMAVRDGLLRLNPTEGVMAEIKKSHCWEKTKRHALTVAEQRAFTNYIANSEEYRGWFPLFTVMLGTGCRIGEVLGLRWQDVDFKNRTISINHNLVYRVQEDGTCTNHVNSPKTKAGIRIIPMIDEVFDAFLEEYQYQKVIGFCTDEIDGYSGFVFCTGDGKVYLPNAINRTIRSICADYNKEEESKAKEENRDPVLLPKFSCHILRHTFCTRFCENETNLKVIQEIMGHADISTTMDVYAEATQEKKKESMTSLQSALLVR